MQQHLHLLVVDPRRRSALIQTVERRWMLPVVACSERARAPLVAARWLAARQLPGVVAGQWLGRIAADGRTIDWLIAIAACTAAESPPFSWAPFHCLEATSAALDYQTWAVECVATGDGVGVSGPFGSLDWIDDARSWIQRAGLTGVSNPICFRASANDVVLGLRSGCADLYFKGVAADRASEVHAMAAAAQALPASFPRSIALEDDSSTTRWLLAGCAGVPLARVRDHDAIVRVASDIGRVQQRLAPRFLPSTLSLSDVLQAADGLLDRAGLSTCSATRRAFDDAMSLTTGWTPLDLDPSNVFVDGPQTRYIDLEPRVSAMPMALSIFARRTGATGGNLQALRRAYEATSKDEIPWTSVDVVSEVTETVNGWQKVLRNVERGEVTGPLGHIERAVAKRVASAKPLV